MKLESIALHHGYESEGTTKSATTPHPLPTRAVHAAAMDCECEEVESLDHSIVSG